MCGMSTIPSQPAEPGVAIDRPRWRENLPFWLVHAVALAGAIMVGWSWQAFAWLAITYSIRMFAITGGYHRYFSHRSYKTSRAFQLILGVLAVSTAQQGPLWWAAHHRNHHKFSDQPEDIHSPRQRGFWWSHMFWLLGSRHRATQFDRIKDFAKYPELRFLNKYDMVFAVGFGFLMYFLGGWTGVVWGHFVSIVIAWHVTFCINSLTHVWGSRRYATNDDSRNNVLLGFLAFGEGWHNNHHHYQRTAKQGFYWYEIDITYYTLKALELVGIVWDVAGVPDHVRDDVLSSGGTQPEIADLPLLTDH